MRKIQGMKAYRRVAGKLRPNIDIREGHAHDLESVHAWLNPEREDRPLNVSPGVTPWVATLGNMVVGFVELVRRDKSAGVYAGYWLHSLNIRSFARGMGIGETLCNRLILTARKENAAEIRLLVNKDNRRAIALYRKLGFCETIIPELEPLLEQEAVRTRRRRVAMLLKLAHRTPGIG